MRRLLVSLATIIILAGLGFIVGRLSVSAPTSSGQENVPVVWTVPVLITATQDPNAGPVVTIITATPLPGSIGVLPTGVIEDAELAATEAPAPTIDQAILEGDSVLQATVTALPEHCIAHVLADGEYPGLVAETYGVSVFDLLAVNGLDEELGALPGHWHSADCATGGLPAFERGCYDARESTGKCGRRRRNADG